jgi:hypothetical protein
VTFDELIEELKFLDRPHSRYSTESLLDIMRHVQRIVIEERERQLNAMPVAIGSRTIDVITHFEERAKNHLADLVTGYVNEQRPPKPIELLTYGLNGPAWAIAQKVLEARGYRPEYR